MTAFEMISTIVLLLGLAGSSVLAGIQIGKWLNE